MIRRAVLLGIILVALAAGAALAWVALSVPRDISAQGVLKEARDALRAGEIDAARARFQQVIKDYPRTDAAAAASYALFRLYDQERAELRARIELLERERSQQGERLAAERKEREADRQRMEELEEKVGQTPKAEPSRISARRSGTPR